MDSCAVGSPIRWRFGQRDISRRQRLQLPLTACSCQRSKITRATDIPPKTATSPKLAGIFEHLLGSALSILFLFVSCRKQGGGSLFRQVMFIAALAPDLYISLPPFISFTLLVQPFSLLI
eukprot:m.205633 g.205633  ORF g.205633 m.205633 type:complete len:120 (+) comp16898_c9_seq7:601-960(+)